MGRVVLNTVCHSQCFVALVKCCSNHWIVHNDDTMVNKYFFVNVHLSFWERLWCVSHWKRILCVYVCEHERKLMDYNAQCAYKTSSLWRYYGWSIISACVCIYMKYFVHVCMDVFIDTRELTCVCVCVIICIYIYIYVRAPNHLLLSAHCKDLIKMCKSMTNIMMVWMDKYLPIECIFQWILQSHPMNTYPIHTHLHTLTCFNQFHLSFHPTVYIPFEIPNSIECHSFIVVFSSIVTIW